MSRKLGGAVRVRVQVRPIPGHVRRWQHQAVEQDWRHLTYAQRRVEARRGVRVGVTKPTLAARKAKRRAERKARR